MWIENGLGFSLRLVAVPLWLVGLFRLLARTLWGGLVLLRWLRLRLFPLGKLTFLLGVLLGLLDVFRLMRLGS